MVSHKQSAESSTTPLKLMRKHKVSIASVTRAAGLTDQMLVARVLNPEGGARCQFRKVTAVRAAVERLLGAMGEDINPDTFWQEYDQEAAA